MLSIWPKFCSCVWVGGEGLLSLYTDRKKILNQNVENAGVAFVKGVDERNNYFEKIRKISNV